MHRLFRDTKCAVCEHCEQVAPMSHVCTYRSEHGRRISIPSGFGGEVSFDCGEVYDVPRWCPIEDNRKEVQKSMTEHIAKVRKETSKKRAKELMERLSEDKEDAVFEAEIFGTRYRLTFEEIK